MHTHAVIVAAQALGRPAVCLGAVVIVSPTVPKHLQKAVAAAIAEWRARKKSTSKGSFST